MSAMGIDLVGRRIREYFLLEGAGRRSSALTPSQRESLREYYDAAVRRLAAVEDLRGPSHAAAALSMYREASLFLALAFIVSKDPGAEVASLSAEDAFTRVSALLDAGEKPPVEFDQSKPLLLSVRRLELDELPAEEAARKADQLEVTTRWLASLVEPRSPHDLKVDRGVRVGVIATLLLVAVAGLLVWGLSPRNLALKRPVTASSTSFSTTPEGAVDGEKNGRYGFHTVEEESPWLSIDLGKSYSIKSVKVFGRGDPYHDQSIPLALEASADGVSFHKVAGRVEPFSESEPWVAKLTGVDARFLRLRVERRSYLVLSEVEIYGR